MHDRLELDIAGEPMVLMADRALFWPARKRLLIADLHLGKADVFRRAGIGLPAGGTRLDLERAGALAALTGAEELWVLGDVLHGPATDTHWRRSWEQWRAGTPGLQVAALAGNHDRALASAGLDIALLGEAVDDGPFALRHVPEPHPSLHVVAGHVHPCVALPGLGSRRWPAFWLQARTTVLPAFSAFTGGWAVSLARGEALGVCVRDTLAFIDARNA